MTDSPDRGVLYLDEDVSQFLHELADREFEGDVQMAMNETIRAMQVAMTKPQDPWASVSWQAGRKAVRKGRQR